MELELFFNEKTEVSPFSGIKKITKLHLVMLQGEWFGKYTWKSYGFMHDTLSKCTLQMYEVSLKYLRRLSSYSADTILWRTDPQTDTRGKNTHAKVMVLVYDTLSECALQMYDVSLKYL